MVVRAYLPSVMTQEGNSQPGRWLVNSGSIQGEKCVPLSYGQKRKLSFRADCATSTEGISSGRVQDDEWYVCLCAFGDTSYPEEH